MNMKKIIDFSGKEVELKNVEKFVEYSLVREDINLYFHFGKKNGEWVMYWNIGMCKYELILLNRPVYRLTESVKKEFISRMESEFFDKKDWFLRNNK